MVFFTYDKQITHDELYMLEQQYFANKNKFKDFCCNGDGFLSPYSAYYLKDNKLFDVEQGEICNDYHYLKQVLSKTTIMEVFLFKNNDDSKNEKIIEKLKEIYKDKYEASNPNLVREILNNLFDDIKEDRLAYFNEIKIGDMVWSIEFGWGVVTSISPHGMLEVHFGGNKDRDFYDMEGKRYKWANQTLFWDEVKFEKPNQKRK